MSAIAYINHQGGLRSSARHSVAQTLLLWVDKHLSSIRAVNLPGSLNSAVDLLSRGRPHPSEWRLHPATVHLIWARFGKARVDLFASKESWCIRCCKCPKSGALTSVLEFLQELFEQGKSPSTLKVFRAAVSGLCTNCGGPFNTGYCYVVGSPERSYIAKDLPSSLLVFTFDLCDIPHVIWECSFEF